MRYILCWIVALQEEIMLSKEKWTLYLRWLAANAFGELFGLGLSLGVLALFIVCLPEGIGWTALAFLLTIASGALEATVVGFAQYWAMHPWFPTLKRRSWWLGTLVGALIAYVLGYLPSTIMSLGEQSGQATPAAEPEQWIVLLLAAGLGLVGGAVLSFAQYLTLRKAARGAGSWIPANMLAWMLSMPLIFWGIDVVQKVQPLYQTVLILAGVLLLAGAVVGAVHGAFLVRIAERNRIS
jgi:hypothetical protein